MLSNTTLYVYEYISRKPGVLMNDIAKDTGLQLKNVNYHVRLLRRASMVYVSDWSYSSKNVPVMLLSAGNKMDVEKPPIREESIMRHEKRLKFSETFRPRPDEAAAWLLNPITPSSIDMSAR